MVYQARLGTRQSDLSPLDRGGTAPSGTWACVQTSLIHHKYWSSSHCQERPLLASRATVDWSYHRAGKHPVCRTVMGKFNWFQWYRLGHAALTISFSMWSNTYTFHVPSLLKASAMKRLNRNYYKLEPATARLRSGWTRQVSPLGRQTNLQVSSGLPSFYVCIYVNKSILLSRPSTPFAGVLTHT
jgi:hypothetical protein